MTKRIRLGIIGFGTQGGMYAELITTGRVPNIELAALCDIDAESGAVAAAAFPGVPFFSDYRVMLESGVVDAVVTTVPHYLHPELGIAAIESGIHALVEKPAGVYTKQVAELNAVAAAHPEVTFALMFNQRANPLWARLKEIIDAGEIGEILRSNWIITTWWRPQGYYDQSEWRATWGGEGGGVLVNQAPHQLDLWQWLCGVPTSVYSKVRYGFQRDIVVEDEVTAIVEYRNGATGAFVTATHDLVGTDRLEIQGTKGKILVDGSAVARVTRLNRPERELSATMDMSDVVRLFMGGADTSALYSQETIEFESMWGAQHAAVLENFAAAILDSIPLLAPGAEGIYGVRLANAIHLSSWTGKEVPIDFNEEEFLELLNARIRDEGKYAERT